MGDAEIPEVDLAPFSEIDDVIASAVDDFDTAVENWDGSGGVEVAAPVAVVAVSAAAAKQIGTSDRSTETKFKKKSGKRGIKKKRTKANVKTDDLQIDDVSGTAVVAPGEGAEIPKRRKKKKKTKKGSGEVGL